MLPSHRSHAGVFWHAGWGPPGRKERERGGKEKGWFLKCCCCGSSPRKRLLSVLLQSLTSEGFEMPRKENPNSLPALGSLEALSLSSSCRPEATQHGLWASPVTYTFPLTPAPVSGPLGTQAPSFLLAVAHRSVCLVGLLSRSLNLPRSPVPSTRNTCLAQLVLQRPP